MPDHLRTALDNLNTSVPSDWAYTLATVRDERAITERFEPGRPGGASWSLIEMEGRTPTRDELEKYRRARSASPGGVQANFQRHDIDPGSLALVREDADHAEYDATFRETSLGPDKMLGHLALRLTVDKRVPHVAAYVLTLK
ncbi:MAG TPA: hypothetical protein VHN79_09325, partial [Lacunisphaera sp.]|nr:hypothetical protein [Lacunisphaera sp.]